MDNTTRILLVIGAALIIVGLIIFTVVMTVYHWDFSKLSTGKLITNIYPVDEAFADLSFQTETANIVFEVSVDGDCKVICHEWDNMKHTVTVQNGALNVQVTDQRSWYEHIGISFGTPKITVCLPETAYGSLTVRESTGDITIPQDLRFENVDVSVSTGDIQCGASVSQLISLKTTTGDIDLKNANPSDIKLSISTGHVNVSDVVCEGDVNIRDTTGKVRLTNVNCRNLTSQGTTGDMFLENVVGTETFSLKRSTGDIRFDGCDAREIFTKTTTGDVTGSLLSEKIFTTKVTTGKIEVPQSAAGGKCEISTTTGNIKITIN